MGMNEHLLKHVASKTSDANIGKLHNLYEGTRNLTQIRT